MAGPGITRRTFRVADHERAGAPEVSAHLYDAGREDTAAWLVLAHGAGAGQDSPFMVAFARALAARGLRVVTFNFSYTEYRRRLPDSNRALESCWRSVAAAVRAMGGNAALFMGGKSMGGRIASQVAATGGAAAPVVADGLVFLGYPLHPPGRPEQRRVAHWPHVHAPALFVQGTRDPFGSPDELRQDLRRFGGATEVLPIDGGDHSFKVPKGAGRAQDEVYAWIQDAIAAWVRRIAAR